MFNIAQANGMPDFPKDIKISESAIKFLSMCFQRNPRRRANVRQLLNHPWVERSSAINAIMRELTLSPIPEEREDISFRFDHRKRRQTLKEKEELIKCKLSDERKLSL